MTTAAERLSAAIHLESAAIAPQTSELIEAAKEVLAENERLRAALERSVVAIDDWINTWAPDQCDDARVAEARERLGEFGTLWYLATVQRQNRDALDQQQAVPPKADD